MKVHHLLFLSPLLLGGVSWGQNVLDTADLWSTNGAAAPAWSGLVVGANINTTTPGTGTAGNWSLSGTGRSQIGAVIPATIVTPEITILDIGTRARSQVTSNSLLFDIENRAAVGSLNLENLLGAGVAMQWAASYADSSHTWGGSDTIYTYTATVTTADSLLSDIANLGTSFTFSVTDGAGNVLQELSSSTLLNALGITVLQDGSLIGISLDNTYTLNTSFVGGNYVDGLNLNYNASSLVNTSLLGIGNTVLQVSDISLTAAAIPEPSTTLLSGAFLGMFAFLRRRTA